MKKKLLNLPHMFFLFFLVFSVLLSAQDDTGFSRDFLSDMHTAERSCRHARHDAVLFSIAAYCLGQCLVDKPAADESDDSWRLQIASAFYFISRSDNAFKCCVRGFGLTRAPPVS
jgi:hypothetical protein